ncbi:MAG: ATP-binding cassette subfamily B protein [Candidatus Paceibacteria bacterium]|jgi:ATP-binding cassette subfamily B protein
MSKNDIPKRPLSFILYLTKPYKKWFIISVLAVILGTFGNTTRAYVLKKIVDGISSVDLTSTTTILFWVMMFPTVLMISQLMWRMSGFTGAKLATEVETHGYNKLFSYLSKHSQNFFDNRFAGSLSSSVGIASSSAESMVESFLWSYLPTFIGIIFSFFYIMTVSTKLAFILLIFSVFLVALNLFVIKFRRKAAEYETKIQSELRGKTVDVATNMVAVKHFATRDHEVNVVKNLSVKYKKAMLKSWYIAESIITMNAILIGIFIFISSYVLYSAWKVGNVTPGGFILIFTLLASISSDLMFIGTSMNRFSKNYGQIKQSLSEILIDYEVKDIPSAGELKVDQGNISVKDLTFNYHNNESIFKNFNLDIKPGHKVGVVGPSGSGKTTFIKLLLRQYDLSSGSVSIDGQNIANVTQDSLHRSVAIVPQEPILFHRSIKENINYGQNNTDNSKIIEAAKKAQAHDFIVKLPDGYDTLVGERGVKLSAGQRQRIAIARAILKNAPILILDEATSALDSESEVLIQKALTILMEGKTVIAIAHRLSTISEMDRILVIRGGIIAEDGNHQELLEKGGTYSGLWNHQAGGFITE